MPITASEQVLEALRSEIESDGFTEGFGNALPAGMNPRAFAGHLSQLEQRGLYLPLEGPDRGFFGEVKMALAIEAHFAKLITQ